MNNFLCSYPKFYSSRKLIKGRSFLNLIHGILDDDVLCLFTNILDSTPLIKTKTCSSSWDDLFWLICFTITRTIITIESIAGIDFDFKDTIKSCEFGSTVENRLRSGWWIIKRNVITSSLSTLKFNISLPLILKFFGKCGWY